MNDIDTSGITDPDPEAIRDMFIHIATLARVSLDSKDLTVEILPAPHKPKGLPRESMAVYVFAHRGVVLKVGKAGPNSDARYRSQHYSAGSAPSTLAASILKNTAPLGDPDVDQESIGDWIKSNTDRVNFILNARVGIEVLTLLEAFVQCVLKPVYEGFSSQK